MSLKDPFSIYFHLPYCAYKCPYCDFNAYAIASLPEAEYSNALIAELKLYSEDLRFKSRNLKTIYFGGGTPSLFSAESIEKIINIAKELFPSEVEEVTLEANPGSINLEYLQKLKTSGVTRLSVGAQSSHEKHLKTLGRRHTKLDVENAIKEARKSGCVNISVDLLFAAPGQTIEELKEDLNWINSLNIEHVSIYGLTIEPGTPLFQSVERGIITPVDQDLQATMYELLVTELKAFGFLHYEISNFGKPGYFSKHNSGYWEGIDYLGIGAGAHSYYCKYLNNKRVSAERWAARANPDEYMKLAMLQKPTRAWSEDLDQKKLEMEFFYLGLRKIEGVSLSNFERLFSKEARVKYEKLFEDLSKKGFVTKGKDLIRFSEQGLLLADSVFKEII